jgi:two-component system chemotaxis response regulator CheY
MVERSTHPLVLIVDDTADARDAMKALLELKGYQVVTAADGQEALDELRHGLDPALILLDLMMPRIDGFRFRKEQLLDPRLSRIPVIIFSGHPDVQNYAVVLGAAGCFQKPVDVDRLLTLVREHCTHPEAAA